MDEATRTLEAAAWAAVDGIATNEQLSLLEANPFAWRRALDRLLDETEDHLDAVLESEAPGVSRPSPTSRPSSTGSRSPTTGSPAPPSRGRAVLVAGPAGEVRLQASWSAGEIVVWAAGPRRPPPRRAVRPPRAHRRPRRRVEPAPASAAAPQACAAALSIPVAGALGWLVAVSGRLGATAWAPASPG